MRKQKFRLFSILLFTYIFSATKITSAQNISIEIPNTYFTENDINDGNKSNVTLNYRGTNGYGLFFIGNQDTDDTDGYELTINGDTINCNRQLKGYYTNNFLNFQLFPIYNKNLNNGTTYETGGLYYDCNKGGITYSGVYGYILWTYKSGTNYPENTHEIRAGVSNGRVKKWLQTSNLKLIEYDQYRALTGNFRDYLAKNAIVTADFSAKERIIIDYPDDYFSSTKIFSGNRNEIYFNDKGNDGFGLFFLGTGIENGPYEISDGTTTLSCSGQLNGYYSFSFNDFGMLPLDEDTEQQRTTDGIDFITGGLYYNCRKKGTNTIYTGVYGYVQRNYNYGNIHEIRAGINYPGGKFISTSPIEVIYSDNFRNINRTLSGQYHDNLAKNSKAIARFFGDLGIIINGEEIKAEGNLDDPYIVLPYADYRNAKLYVKSSKTNTTGYIYLTAFDKNGQQHTGTFDMDHLNSQRKDFGFYEYEETPSNIFGELSPNDLKNGTIYAYLNNGNENWLGIVRFVITGSSDTPDISVTFSGTDCSKTGVTITATSSGSIQYAIVEGNSCNSGSNYNFIEYPVSAGIYLTGAHMGKYICFRAIYQGNTGYNIWQVEGIDNDGPIFSLSNWIGYECQTGELKITDRQGVGCSTFTDQYYWNGLQGGSIYNLYNGSTGSIIVTGEIKDALGNTTTHTGQIRWNDVIPEFSDLENDTITYQNTIATTTTLYSDLIASMGIIDGDCGSGTISKTGDILCYYGTGEWIGKGISVTPPSNYSGYVSCTVSFADDEGNIVRGTVKYPANTIAPDISIQGPGSACSQSQTITATYNGGDMRVRTGGLNVCSGTDWSGYTSGTPLTFNNDIYNSTHICFKAADSLGNISYKETIIDNLDTTSPSDFNRTIVSNSKSSNNINTEECDNVTLQISATDQGCGSGHMTLIISGQTITTDRDGQDITYPISIGDTTNSFEISVTVKDSAGNIGHPAQPITISPINIELTATGFSKTLEESDNGFVARGNWIQLTQAQAGDCELIRIADYNCSKGTRTTNGSGFTYRYIGEDPTNLHCNLKITDGDGEGIRVTANFYDCSKKGIDACKPQLSPIFTGCQYGGDPNYHCNQSQYIHYENIPYDNAGNTADLGKYTSGTTARIQINGRGISTISGYRFTCVEEGRYCKNLDTRNYQNIGNSALTSFIDDNRLTPDICTDPQNARSNQRKYQRPGEEDIFEIKLDGNEGGCSTRNTPYGSINQGTRKVWIELEDVNGYTGIASTDNIIYSTKPPIITEYTPSVMNTIIGEPRSNIYPEDTINSGNFTAHITINSADLPNGTSGQNHKYESQLGSYRLLPGFLWFNSDLKHWLITHFGNN